jgi:hypothetical protein
MNQCLLRSAVPANVHFPDAYGVNFEKAIELRVRAAAILAECVQPVERMEHTRWLRLDALTTMILNLGAEARQRWSTAPSTNLKGTALMAFVMLQA